MDDYAQFLKDKRFSQHDKYLDVHGCDIYEFTRNVDRVTIISEDVDKFQILIYNSHKFMNRTVEQKSHIIEYLKEVFA